MSNHILEEINRDCVVQPGNLRIPEYTFMKIYDFARKKPKIPYKRDKDYILKLTQYELDHEAYHGQIDKLCIVMSALLNTSGGVIIVQSANKSETKTIDSWLNNLHQQLNVIPKWIYDESVRTSVRADTVNFLVKRAPVSQLITFKSHLYVRNPGASTEMCNDTEHLRTIINKVSTKHVCAGYDSKKKGDEVGAETQNLEHKYWNIWTSDDILEKLTNHRKALVGLSNVDGGGDFVIGVEEDKSSGKNLVRGVDLSQAEREIFPDKLESWLTTLITGKQTKLRRGVDWSVKFVNVCEEAGEEERCLVIIHLNHCQGGLFLRKPQCYMVTDKGDIKEMPFEQWLNEISVTASSSANLQVSLTCASLNLDASSPSISARSLTSEASSLDLHEPTSTAKTAELVDLSSKPQKYLSNTQHISGFSLSQNDDWRKHLEDQDTPDDYGDVMARLDINEKSPILFSPCEDKVISMCLKNCNPGSFIDRDIRTALHLIQKRHSGKKGFALCFCSWDQAFDNDDSLTAPTWHVLDVLVKTEDSMELIAVFGDDDRFQGSAHTQYLYLLSRKIKRHLLSELKQIQQNKIANIIISPVICNIKEQRMKSCLAPSDLIVKDFLDAWGSEQMMTQETLTESLKNLLLTKSTHIRDRVNRDRNLRLTERQVECTVRCIDSRFTIIDAAPGAGKSVMVSYLIDRWNGGDKHKVLCICPRKPFAQLLLNQQKCEVVQACDDATIYKVIHKIIKVKYVAIIVDDGQAMACQQKTWTQFYIAVLKSKCREVGTKLCIVLDSRFQIFDGLQNANVIKKSFRKFCNENNITPTELSLRKVLRNEQKVFSFMVSNILQEQSPDANDFLCYQTREGDDVQLNAVARMWEDSRGNGLILYVEMLVNGDTYMPTDTVILVDKEKDAQYLRELYGKHRPEVPVHDASRIPADGVTIETTANVIGLEYPVVLHASRKNAKETRSFKDRRYRTFIASRGISRVEFLFPKSFPGVIAKTMVHEDVPRPASLLDKDYDQPCLIFGGKSQEMGHLHDIDGVCVLVSGNVVVCNKGGGCLSVYNPQGNFITSHTMADLHDVASTPDSGMVCVTEKELHRLDKEGHAMWKVGLSNLNPPDKQLFHHYPVSVCVDRQGMIYTRLSHSVCVLRADGKVIRSIVENVPISIPNVHCGIAVQPSGEIILPDSYGDRVIVLSESGQYNKTFGEQSSLAGGLSQPCGVAVDVYGNIAVTNRQPPSVNVYSPKGKYIRRWAVEGMMPGDVSYPTGIVISPSGDIFICDIVHSRVLKY